MTPAGVTGMGAKSKRTEGMALLKTGASPNEVAETLGVDVATARRWRNGDPASDQLPFECEDCGGQFTCTRAYHKSREVYLCKPCADKRRRRRIPVTCRACGDGFEVVPSVLENGGGRYCSAACRASVNQPPVQTPEVRAKISRALNRNSTTPAAVYRHFNLRLKGETTCRNCGAPVWDLHHAIPRSMCRAALRDLRNGLPLCRKCHRGWHSRKITIYRDVFTREEWDYISSVELLGQNIEAWLDERYPERTGGVGWPE